MARPVERQGLAEQRIDRVERSHALRRRHGGGHAGAQVAFVNDAVQQVMRRQARRGNVPCSQQGGRTLQVRVVGPIALQRGPPVRASGALRECDQVVVGRAEQRAAQGLRKRKAVAGRDQHTEHSDQVTRFRRVHQRVVFDGGARHMQPLQGLRDQAQRFALAAEHDDVAGAHRSRPLCAPNQRTTLPREQRLHGSGHERGLAFAQHFFGFGARGGQRVAPHGRCIASQRLRWPQHAADAEHARAGRRSDLGADLGGVGAEAAELAGRAGLREHAVQRRDHFGCVAPRVVAFEQRATQRLHHELARGLEHAWFGAAKAVDALLRVTDDEHARRPLAAGAAARAGIGAQPRMQRVPLQRAGVLKLVDQHVADARIEPLLHPAGERGVAQQREAAAFQVGHVGQAAGAFVGIELGQQHARQPHHAQVLGMRAELLDLRGDLRKRVLRGGQAFDLAELLARRVGGGEQCPPGRIERGLCIGVGQRHHQAGSGVLCAGAAQTERERQFAEQRAPGRTE